MDTRANRRMPPRKQDKEIEPKKETKPDRDLFIRTFEKPTQIYKFLRARFKHSPYFLSRNLTYMTRTEKRKSSFQSSVDDISLKILKQRLKSASPITEFKYLTINYLGFFSKEIDRNSKVNIDTLLMKVSNKKRKANISPVETIPFQSVTVPCNPSDENKFIWKKIIIPTDKLSLSNSHSVKSYTLLFLVSIPTSIDVFRDSDNGPSVKKCKLANSKDEKNELVYGSNLNVYDKFNGWTLMDGKYELLIHELTQNSPKITHVNSSWRSIPDLEENETSTAIRNYVTGPNLKLISRWTNNPEEDDVKIVSGTLETNGKRMANVDNQIADCKIMKPKPKEESQMQIIYQFLYNNNSRQQTEPLKDFFCPWCPKLNCFNLYSLLKHLKLCHARFTFAFTEIPLGGRIDVALNDKYDGLHISTTKDTSYRNMGFSNKKQGPVRRVPVSKILVCHPKRPRTCTLSEFLNDKDDTGGGDGQRAYISSHNRTYHHTATCLPIYSEEMDIDSENEGDPKWLQKKTTMMIDDFTDVNDGEKELMKMWNSHVMKHGYVGDCQIPLACDMFLKTRGQDLLNKNLYRNFVLHMCNLFDFGLVSPVIVYKMIQQLQELIGENTKISKILHESWSLQRVNWLKNIAVVEMKQAKSNVVELNSIL